MCYCAKTHRSWGGYFLAMAAGSFPGLLIGNALLVLVWLNLINGKDHGATMNQLGVVTLFVGPFLASSLGVAAGGGFGWYLLYRWRQKGAVDDKVTSAPPRVEAKGDGTGGGGGTL